MAPRVWRNACGHRSNHAVREPDLGQETAHGTRRMTDTEPIPLEPNLLSYLPLGSTLMSRVTDHCNRVFGCRNRYVCDGAVLRCIPPAGDADWPDEATGSP